MVAPLGEERDRGDGWKQRRRWHNVERRVTRGEVGRVEGVLQVLTVCGTKGEVGGAERGTRRRETS